MKCSPAAERNKEVIRQVLNGYLSDGRKSVLEIASGCGVHVAHNSVAFPEVTWQPTDLDPSSVQSIRAHLDALNRPANVSEPLILDVGNPPQGVLKESYDLMMAVNLVHITEWSNACALFELAGQKLVSDVGLLFLYGPFAFQGSLEPQSNRDFDSYLKMNNPGWGVRDFVQLEAEAAKNGLAFHAKHSMPANNHILVWRKL